MAYKGTKVKTMRAPLKYVFIKGEGRNNAMRGDEPRYQYVASVELEKDSKEHKHFKDQVDAEWKKYKEEFGVKGLPKTNGMKPVMISDPSGAIDPETEEVAKIDSGKVLVTFKTNTVWPDGKPQVVKVFKGDGADITKAVHAAEWYIGEGSEGVIHGTAQGNDIGGTHKVTLYLSAVQLAKLVKGEGNDLEVEAMGDADDIDLGEDAVEAIPEDEKPAI